MTIKAIDPIKLQEIISTCKSWIEIKRLLGGVGNYRIKRLVKENNIDVSHFIKRGPNKKCPIESYLSNERPAGSNYLKLRLYKAGLKKKICERCENDMWQGQEIPLELHHVDGDSKNNRLENLKILCRNCHGLEANHKGSARKRKKITKISLEEYISAINSSSSVIEVCNILNIVPKSGNYDTIHGIMLKHGLSFKARKDAPRDIDNLSGMFY